MAESSDTSKTVHGPTNDPRHPNPLEIMRAIQHYVHGASTQGEINMVLADLINGLLSPFVAIGFVAHMIANSNDSQAARKGCVVTICNVAADMPYAHEILAQFCLYLGQGDAQFVSELANQLCRMKAGETYEEPLDQTPKNIARFVGIHGFIAHLHMVGLTDGPMCARRVELTLCALWYGLECSRDKTSELQVEAAAQYFIHAGPRIWSWCRERRGEKEQKEAKEEDTEGEEWVLMGPSWYETKTDDAPYCVQRWNFWRERLLANAQDTKLSKGTRRACQAAMQAMESSMKVTI